MNRKIVWTFQFEVENPKRKTFYNGIIINLLDDGSLYCPERNIYSEFNYQSIDDITPEELTDFINSFSK